MCYPFEEYAFIPHLEQNEELEDLGLLKGPAGPTNVTMYNALACAVDRNLVVEVAGEKVTSGWTKTILTRDLAELTCLHPDVAIRVLKRISGVFNREWDGDKHSYKYQLKSYERNHDRLEKEGSIKSKTPFESYYCLPYKDRLSSLRKHNLADSTTLAVYDAILSYVDRNNKEGRYISGWTIVISQASIAKRAGVNVDCVNKTILKLLDKELIERKSFGNKYRYRVAIWEDALESVRLKGVEHSDRLQTIAGPTVNDQTTDSGIDIKESLESFTRESPPSNVSSTSKDHIIKNDLGTSKRGSNLDSYLKEKADDLAVSFNNLFRGARFMSKRLKRIYSNKIFDSLCDVVSEEKVMAMGDKAGDLAVKAHEHLFDKLVGKENAPYSPGWLFTEVGAAALSGVMGSLLNRKRPQKQAKRVERKRIDPETLDPFTKKLYNKYVKGRGVYVDKETVDAGGTVAQTDGGKEQKEPPIPQGYGGGDNRPCEIPIQTTETKVSQTETPQASPPKEDEGVVVSSIRRVFDRIVLASPEERIAQIRELCNFGNEIDDMDILIAEHQVRGFA